MGTAIDVLLALNPEFLLSRFGKISQRWVEHFPRQPPPRVLNNKVGMKISIARAHWNVTEREKRLLMLAISKIDYSEEQIQQEWGGDGALLPFGTVVITAVEYTALVGCTMRDAYQDLKTATNSLQSKVLTLVMGGIERKVNFTKAANYDRVAGLVEIEFNSEFLGFLTRFKSDGNRYVSYYLHEVKRFSLPQWRLFELLLSYHHSNAMISMDDLKFVMGCGKWTTRDFRRDVLNPAIDGLSKNRMVQLEALPVMRGPKIQHFKFTRKPGKHRKSRQH
ncbi:replication initiation protein [Methylophaga nitratireducenticrescens]|uniref:replication initiation protein n=1 Tax=Methylophaga nitratireducenticrescens TaxID=754476 RepID=UPI000CDC5A4B|nr:replication initiation protein [Methylophaga nitratireducenticrescens]AUZ85146.1 hypothetical protein CDW43_11455 [Methylophaga nitratireducenticrescens]